MLRSRAMQLHIIQQCKAKFNQPSKWINKAISTLFADEYVVEHLWKVDDEKPG